ncbi:hypothetical protein TNCV_3311721 [Trichonephila clavipes]|nr:hypothetical protein TNCV_3311721 [Trichonephila clavipes]
MPAMVGYLNHWATAALRQSLQMLQYINSKLSNLSPLILSCPAPVIENADKITEIIEVDRHVSSRRIAQELKIDHKTIKPFEQSWTQIEARCLGATPKKHDGSNFHLRDPGQME